MMKYTAKILKNDYDYVYTDGINRFPCYSAKKIRNLSPDGDYKIVGMTRNYNGDDEFAIDLGINRMTVIPVRRTPRFKTVGYVPLETADHSIEYIAVQKERGVIATQVVTMMERIIERI